MGKITMEEQSQEKEVTIKLSKSGLWQIISGILGVLLIISIFTGGFGFGSTSSNTPTGGTTTNTGNNQVLSNSIFSSGVVNVDAASGQFLGPNDAKVIVLEYSDFQCPYCERFHSQTYPELKSRYIDNNKIKFVYKQFPIVQIHPNAQPAAEASLCAAEQGKFWEYHDLLFNNQGILGEENYKKWAQDLELDMNKFNDCISSRKYKIQIDKDTKEATDLVPVLQLDGIGTPSFLIIANKKYSESTFSDIASSPYARNVKVAKDKEGNSVVFVSGALPFDAFDAILKKFT